jgi:hypothetical protein
MCHDSLAIVFQVLVGKSTFCCDESLPVLTSDSTTCVTSKHPPLTKQMGAINSQLCNLQN